MTASLRVVVAGPPEDQGPARALRDAGVEVVLIGEPASASEAARAAVHEDADALLLADPGLVESVTAALAEQDAADVLVATVAQLPVERPGQWLRDHLIEPG